MESSYIHLLINHFPVIGMFFLIPLLIYGMVKRNEQVNNFALTGLIVLALLTIPVFLSGEIAEEAVEHMQGIEHDVIEEHEEAGELAMWAMQVLNLLAVVTLWMNLKKHAFSRFFKRITLVISFFVLGLMINSGLTGGKIRRPELSKQAAPAAKAPETKEHHDND